MPHGVREGEEGARRVVLGEWGCGGTVRPLCFSFFSFFFFLESSLKTADTWYRIPLTVGEEEEEEEETHTL